MATTREHIDLYSMLRGGLENRLCRCEHVIHGQGETLVVWGKRTPTFNAQAFLDSAGLAKQIVEYARAEVIFSQGDRCDSSRLF